MPATTIIAWETTRRLESHLSAALTGLPARLRSVRLLEEALGIVRDSFRPILFIEDDGRRETIDAVGEISAEGGVVVVHAPPACSADRRRALRVAGAIAVIDELPEFPKLAAWIARLVAESQRHARLAGGVAQQQLITAS